MRYAYVIWSTLLLIPWLGLFLSLRTTASRRKMLLTSVATTPLGLTEPFFVPEYWLPPTLFDLARLTGFDVESLIFSFAVGGIAAIGYDVLGRRRSVALDESDRGQRRHRFHLPILLSGPAIFLGLSVTTDWNPIYTSSVSLLTAGMLTWYCRPDLARSMISTGIGFAAFYFAFFMSLVLAHPQFVEEVWNLNELSGILVAGVPLEELLFAFSLGFVWSSVYEHVAWKRFDRRKT